MSSLSELAAEYLSWDPCAQTRGEVEALLANGESSRLQEMLTTRLSFGTAGLRGPMGPGYNRMNDLVITQTIQGLIAYLKSKFEGDIDNLKRMGVIIGFDHRKKGELSSFHFAEICAAMLLSQDIKVFFLDGFVPTPFVPFGVTYYGCAAGIMITASHNPKDDNGFKLYWGNGAQIIPPHDTGIASSIDKNLSPWTCLFNADLVELARSPIFSSAADEIAANYCSSLEKISAQCLTPSPLKVAYTAMHGVGCKWIERAFSHLRSGNNLQPLLVVPSQKDPDPSFPTVRFPNPEEKGALDEAILYATDNDCQLIIANDPDADRLAVAERQINDCGDISWKIFSGNDVGTMLGHYQINRFNSLLKENAKAAVVTTVVSSGMLRKIADMENIACSTTLTGFKWIGNESLRLSKLGYQVLFSYEEALGYCVGDTLTDKDGISAAVAMIELANSLKLDDKTLNDYLESLQIKYGAFVSYNTYLFSHDDSTTKEVFRRLRECGHNGYMMHFGGANVSRVRDVTLGFDSATADKVCTLPLTPESQMVMYEFDNDISITLRTSGTEPKIKLYSEFCGNLNDHPRHELESILTSFIKRCIPEMLEPEKNGLVYPNSF